MKRKTAKFEINDILPIALTIVVAGIGVAYGLQIQGDMRDDFVADNALTKTCNSTLNGGTGSVTSGCGADVNASLDSIEGVAKLPAKFPIIVNVVVAAIIIGILIRYLMVRYS